MRRRLALLQSTNASVVAPAVSIVTGLVALAVVGFLVIAKAPWWVVGSAAAGFVAGSIATLVGGRFGWISQPHATSFRKSHARGYIVPHETPPALLDFHGRDAELDDLGHLLTGAKNGKAQVALIAGPAGVGKTALAVQFAASNLESFPGGQLFARLEHGADHNQQAFTLLGRFITALGFLGEQLPGDRAGRQSAYDGLTAHRRILLVLDDADSADAVASLLPTAPGCAAIVTSREDLKGLEAHRIELKPLPETEAVGLLQSVMGDKRAKDDPHAAREIARGGHPLSVRLAGTALNDRPYLSLGQAVTRMQEQRPLPDKTSVTVLKGKLDLSYAFLAEDEQKALRCLGLLGKHVVSPWELAALLDTDEADAIRLADNLVQAQLIWRASGGRAGVVRFEVHEHVLEYAKARMLADTEADEREKLGGALRAARSMRARRADSLEDKLNVMLPAWKDEGSLAKALDEARDALSIAEESDRPADVALALATLGDLHVELGNTDEAMEMAQEACDVAGGRKPARALRCLAKVMRRMRRLDAAQAYLAEALTAAGDDVAEQIRIHVERAAVLALTEERESSLAVADQAVSLCRRHREHIPMLTSALWARGNALLSCHRGQEAFTLLDEAARKASDDQALWRAWVHWLRGKAALEDGRLEEAAKSETDALEAFGTMAHRFGVAQCRLVLGRVHVAGGKNLPEAIALLTDALETFQNCNDLWTVADAKRHLASAMVKAEQRGKAVQLLQDAERTFRALGDHENLAATHNDLLAARKVASKNVLKTRGPEIELIRVRRGR